MEVLGFISLLLVLAYFTVATLIGLLLSGDDFSPASGSSAVVLLAILAVEVYLWICLFESSPFSITIK